MTRKLEVLPKSSAMLILEYRYDPVSGNGSVGVELAGTAVTSGGPFNVQQVTVQEANNVSAMWATENLDLQWSEGYFRGFFTLEVSPETLNATYYSMRDVSECSQFFISSLISLSSPALKLSETLTDLR
jgi:alkaline phosphatase D